jgi:hypothetical protein
MADTPGSHTTLHPKRSRSVEWGPSQSDPSPQMSDQIQVSTVTSALSTETRDYDAGRRWSVSAPFPVNSNEAEIRKALGVLIEPSAVFEVRAPKNAKISGNWKTGTVSGYFDNIDSCIAELGKIESAEAVYVTLNPVNPALLARRKNRLDYSKGGDTTSDHDVTERRWLLIDCDPQRPQGISASNPEKDRATAKARKVYTFLVKERGWPTPVACDSGNGNHLLFRIALPTDDAGLVKRVLEGLNHRFGGDGVKIDCSVFNPARITKLYGTPAMKGDNTPERPHRLSKVLVNGSNGAVVTREQLGAVADELAPQKESRPVTSDSNGAFDMEVFFAKHSIATKHKTTVRDGRTMWILAECPFNADHGAGTDTVVFQWPDGKCGFKCQHDSDQDKHWRDFRLHYEPEAYSHESHIIRGDVSKAETPKQAVTLETKRSAKNGGELQGSAVICPATEPWPEAVDGAAVLDDVAKTFSSYLALPDGAAEAIALWTMHAHTYEAFIHSPRLNFRSPMKGCGKTLALDVVAVLTPRSLRTESITPAVLFRLVEGQKPTLLLDETDTYLKEADELRGLLNAGHKRGAVALRCEGESNTVRAFKAFAPAALAGIRELPGTLHDRAIVIELVRAKRGEVRKRFDSRRTDRETELRQKCARWAADNFGALKDCDPQLPETAFNRLADNWRPLFAIAEVMGADWPKRASEAFAKLTSSNDLDAQGVATTLLADIAAIFGKEDTDKLPSSKLADSLAAIEGRPWGEWGRQRKPISPNQLANQLHPFGISPQVIRIGNETPRGYLLEQFQEPFDRYLPKPPLPDRNSATTLGKTLVSEVQHPHGVLHPGNGTSKRECCGVAPCAGGQEQKEQPEREDRDALAGATGTRNGILGPVTVTPDEKISFGGS